MALDTPRGIDTAFFEFNGDLLPDELATTSDSGTIDTTSFVGRGSALRIDNSNGGDNEMAEVDAGKLEYSVQDGQMYVEARVKVERVTGAANIGFNDDTGEGSNTLPMELSGTTWTSNAATWIGFVWDSDATNDTWHVMWVDDDADSSTAIATLNSGITVAADVWYTLRVHLFDQGSGNQARATFSVSDGTNAWEYETSGTIDRDVNMTWHLAVENRTGTGCFMDVDYIEAGRSRQNTAP
jgi:hypothetical protein